MSLSSQHFSNYGATSLDPEVVIQPSSSREISSLCDNISTNIETINSCVRFFTTVSEQIGTQKDSQGLRDQILVRIMSSNQLVKASQKDLAKLNSLARSAGKEQKLQIQRLTGFFKDVVERNCQTQQSVLDKLKSNVLLTPDMTESGSMDSNLLQLEQCQIQKNLEFEKELLLERQHRIKQIESQICDANQLMRELSAIINDQGTMVDSIERQIENVNENVYLARDELTSAAVYQAKSRKRKFLLLTFLAIVLIVLIGVIIWSSTT